ncbi:unnamed protein product, partial [Agarophyton chilense]
SPRRSTRAPPAGAPQPADAAIAACDAAIDGVRVAALLSRNESLCELPTPCLRFLLLHYLRAAALHAWQGDPSARLHHLQLCDAALDVFFVQVDAYALLGETERRHVLPDAERVDDESSPSTLAPAQRREQKIARFRLERAAEARLNALLDGLERRGDADRDDADQREAWLLLLKSAVRRALDLFATLREEIAILRFAERQRAKGMDPRVKADQARASAPSAVLPHMPPTFRIVNERQRERDAVFRPSHSLPTYTVEQWGEIEAQRLARVEMDKSEKDIAAKRRSEQEDSDGEDAVLRQTMEARRWDDWKDEHNKGSGNTIR